MKVKVLKHFDTIPDLIQIGGENTSAAIDLYCAEDVEICPGEFKLINLGVSIEVPKGYKIELRSKSSSFKKFGIIQTNGIGLVDNSYCGKNDILMLPVFRPINYTLFVDAIRGNEPQLEPIVIKAGTPIAQIEIMKQMEPIDIEYVEADFWQVETDRGGFGAVTEKHLVVNGCQQKNSKLNGLMSQFVKTQ